MYVPLAQPYGRFASEMLTTQRYPEVKLVPGKDIVRPYDVSAWSLPLMMGVPVERGDAPGGAHARGSAGPRRAAADGAAFALAPGSPETARLVNVGAARRRQGASRARRRTPVVAMAGGHRVPRRRRGEGRGRQGRGGPSSTAGRRPSGGAEPLRAPRVGLYKPWLASMDEGWTRFVLEQYGFAPKTLDNKAVRAGSFDGGST